MVTWSPVQLRVPLPSGVSRLTTSLIATVRRMMPAETLAEPSLPVTTYAPVVGFELAASVVYVPRIVPLTNAFALVPLTVT